MLTELDIKAPGETTNNTVSVLRPGQTMQFTKESTMRVRRMVLVSSLLLMGLCTGATSRWTKSKVKVSISGVTIRSTLVRGWTIKCTARDTWSGLMASSTKDSSRRTRGMALASSYGGTGASTRVAGTRASSTVMDSTLTSTVWSAEAPGSMANDNVGTTIQVRWTSEIKLNILYAIQLARSLKINYHLPLICTFFSQETNCFNSLS